MSIDLLPLFACPPPGLHDVYSSAMRNSLFTGFLTLCGFLLTAKTFLVVNMNKEVYASDHYLENFRVQRKLDGSLEVYRPLNNIATLLHYNILFAVITSVCQFTIGFIPSPLAAGVCLTVAATTLGVLIRSLFKVRENLRGMFEFMESVAKLKIAELERKSQKAAGDRKAQREKEVSSDPPPAPPDAGSRPPPAT